MINIKRLLTALLLPLLWITPVLAQDFPKDLALEKGALRSDSPLIVGKTVRIYATVKNNSTQDLYGTVKFYDENAKEFIGEDQPVSAIKQNTDDVFIDWKAKAVGTYRISARVVPWVQEGDDPSNNKTTLSVYVDVDSDGDGIANAKDPDDDNDGTLDGKDAFPLDPKESLDTDGDGIGNNVDQDDDGDGVPDVQDAFPVDTHETIDTDKDGVGDKTDIFPTNPKETADSDQDGLGDNSDPSPHHKGPVASINTENTVVSTGSVVTFNALKSADTDGKTLTYEWDFGHGVESTSVVADKTFDKAGTYNVKLKVTDDKGESRESTLTITVIHHWQTLFLILICLLLFLLLLYYFLRSKKVLDKNKKKA